MKRKYTSVVTAFFFLLPNLAGFILFMLFPIVLSLIMAFTNWSLKPALEFQFVGLRNFADILGLRAASSGHTTEADTNLLLCVCCGLGLLGHFRAVLENWRGIRLAGVLLVLLGCGVIVVSGLNRAAQGAFIVGGLFILLGLLTQFRDDGVWHPGRGLLPFAAIVAGVLGLNGLHHAMWLHYEPNDMRFWHYLYNTLYLMLGMPVGIAGSLALALLINDPLSLGSRRRRLLTALLCSVGGAATFALFFAAGMSNIAIIGGLCWFLAAAGLAFDVVAFRTIYYLPTFTAGVALMVLWKALYNPESGPINTFLEFMFTLAGSDLRGPRWLASIMWAKPALIIMGVWIGIGGMNMLLYLAGLSTVPKDLLDAARVDGANRWTTFRHVTWPHLAPTTFFITIISIIGGLQGGFEQARVMTLGGPAGSTTTLSYYIYNIAFGELDLGKAAAISWVLFGFVFAATAINWKFGKGLEMDY